MADSPDLRVLNPEYGGTFGCEGGWKLPFVLPGELVRAEPLRILRAAPERVEPGCVHFGVCGGCHYQHADYAAQVGFKQHILRGLLRQAGLKDLPQIAPHVGEPWGYRNRIRLRVEPEGDTFCGGYSQRGSNEFLPIRMCPISAPLLWRAAEALLGLADEPLGRRWLAAISEVEFFCLPEESRVQAQFFLRNSDPAHGDKGSFGRFCERLQAALPELQGAAAELDPELNRRVRRAWDGAEWGVAGLAYPVAGRSYWVGRGAFFQVNRFLVDRLVTLVCQGQAGSLAWDLFAGVGLFSRALAPQFERVVAVEGAEVAAAALAIAGKSAGFAAVRSPTVDFLRLQEFQRDRPELVVLDPPRAGLGPEGSAILARIGAARVVYVSCDPVTLARDLAILVRDTYAVESIDLIDLFPQTFHLETVVHLRRKA